MSKLSLLVEERDLLKIEVMELKMERDLLNRAMELLQSIQTLTVTKQLSVVLKKLGVAPEIDDPNDPEPWI